MFHRPPLSTCLLPVHTVHLVITICSFKTELSSVPRWTSSSTYLSPLLPVPTHWVHRVLSTYLSSPPTCVQCWAPNVCLINIDVHEMNVYALNYLKELKGIVSMVGRGENMSKDMEVNCRKWLLLTMCDIKLSASRDIWNGKNPRVTQNVRPKESWF